MLIHDTLREWLTEYPRPHTRQAYERDLLAFFAWCEANDVDPMQPGRADINLYRDSLVGRLAGATVDRQINACKSFYRFCHEEGQLPTDPFEHVRRISRPGESTTPWLGEDELRTLLSAARERHVRDFVLVGLLGLNGLRISEVIGAEVSDLGSSGGHRTLRVKRKGGKAGIIPLAPELAAAIDAIVGERVHGPLIPCISRHGAIALPVRRLTYNGAYRRVKALADWCGINPAISPHSLRHSFITLSLSNGVPLHVVQGAAGHSSPATTQGYNRDRYNLDSNPTFGLAEGLLKGEA